jgi:hypothetical protein
MKQFIIIIILMVGGIFTVIISSLGGDGSTLVAIVRR